MNAAFDEMMSNALSLAPNFRAMLAEHLLKSLDSIDQTEIDAAWAVIAEERIQSIQQGTVSLIPTEQILQQLRNR